MSEVTTSDAARTPPISAARARACRWVALGMELGELGVAVDAEFEADGEELAVPDGIAEDVWSADTGTAGKVGPGNPSPEREEIAPVVPNRESVVVGVVPTRVVVVDVTVSCRVVVVRLVFSHSHPRRQPRTFGPASTRVENVGLMACAPDSAAAPAHNPRFRFLRSHGQTARHGVDLGRARPCSRSPSFTSFTGSHPSTVSAPRVRHPPMKRPDEIIVESTPRCSRPVAQLVI
uniref:Uncharacterized protein n=1 Tax=Mycena chlorophos TaxID=658473 RepID=A0ABQ0L469_MYCCL|nr:predicted protein [Mycena chlorophos]